MAECNRTRAETITISFRQAIVSSKSFKELAYIDVAFYSLPSLRLCKSLAVEGRCGVWHLELCCWDSRLLFFSVLGSVGELF